MNDKQLLYKDTKAAQVLAALPAALQRVRGPLLCSVGNPIPGLPCIDDGWGSTVWNEQRRRYLTVTPWGQADLVASNDDLYYYASPLYRLVEPKEDVPMPQAQAPDPGYAVLDTSTGMCTTYDEEAVAVHNTRLSLDNQDVGGRKLLQLVRGSLARAGIPVYPMALYRRDSLSYPWETEEGWETDFRVTRVSNKEVATPLVGFALDPMTEEIVYLHVVGHKSAVRSIWATLNNGGKKKYLTIDTSRHYIRGYSSHNYVTRSTPVDADLGLYRLLIVDKRAVAQEVDERAYLLVPKDATENLHAAFAARLNAVLPIPILPQWGMRLRQEGEQRHLVQMCVKGGDVANAYALTPDTQWTTLVEGLVQSGELDI